MSYTKISIFILFIIIVLLLADFVFAQRELEVPLPQLGTTKLPLLPDYVKYIFNFAVGIAGLIAFIMILIGGVRYLTSAGNPSAMSDANDRIFSGIIGLIVILGSWLILTTINPQLIIIKAEREATPVVQEIEGVYLCKDSEAKDCQIVTQSAATIGELNDNVQSIKFKNPKEFKYGIVLHEDKNYKGNCAVCLSDGCQSEISKIGGDGPSSITVFTHLDRASGIGVTLYDGVAYQDEKWGHIGPFYSELPINNVNDIKKHFGNEASSVKIGVDYMAILFKGKNLGGECAVFTQSDPSLSNEGFDNNVNSFRVIFAR